MHLSSILQNKWWTDISIEPAYALYWVADYQVSFYHQNLLLQKACRVNATHEPDLNTPCDDEKKGLAFVAYAHSGFGLISSIVVNFLCALYIKWSDRAGNKRKSILILPSVGLCLMIVSNCFHTYFWTLHPLLSMVTYNLFEFVTGGPLLYYFAAILYISDVSSYSNRTARLGLLATMQYVCLPVANMFSGFFLKRYGFMNSNLFALAISLGALLLGVAWIKDVSVPVKYKVPFWKSLNPFNIKSSIGIMFKKREHNRRFILNVLLVAKILVLFSRIGEKSVLYLYMRHRFHWDEKDYSYFDAYKNTCIIFGMLISMFVFSKFLKMHDLKIAIFAGTCDTIAAFCYLFANCGWHFYVIAMIDMFHGAAFLAAKSFTTKIVDSSELGDLTAVSTLFTFLLLLNSPAYNMLFKAYMDSFPNCFFLISIAVGILGLISFSVCLVMLKKDEILEDTELVKEDSNGSINLKDRSSLDE